MKFIVPALWLLLLSLRMQAAAYTDTLPPAAILNELALTPKQKTILKQLLADYRQQQAASQRQLRTAVLTVLTKKQRSRLAQLLQQQRRLYKQRRLQMQ